MPPKATNEVVAERQRLKDAAFYLVLKAQMCKGTNDLKLTADLQGALNIDAQKKMKWWNELHAAKREGTLAPNANLSPY